MSEKEKVGNEWRTPPDVMDRARDALGGYIELDPAGAPAGTPSHVNAERSYASDGLHLPWVCDRLWLNPPFSPIKPWLARLAAGWRSGHVRAGIALASDRALVGEGGNEILKSAKALIVPARRIRFIRPDTGEPETSPSFGAVLVAGGDDLHAQRVRWAFEDDGWATVLLDLMPLTAPFPWFGAKRRWAELVWERFGDDLGAYVEPFAGSLAVLLHRETPVPREVVCDLDGALCNFWRALRGRSRAGCVLG